MALIEFSDNIHRLLDDGNFVIGILIDFTKAFDTVDHEILLHYYINYIDTASVGTQIISLGFI